MELEQVHENFTCPQVLVFVLTHKGSSLVYNLFALVKECPAHMHELLTVENLITVVDLARVVA